MTFAAFIVVPFARVCVIWAAPVVHFVTLFSLGFPTHFVLFVADAPILQAPA